MDMSKANRMNEVPLELSDLFFNHSECDKAKVYVNDEFSHYDEDVLFSVALDFKTSLCGLIGYLVNTSGVTLPDSEALVQDFIARL
jgi:hypothetical protein